MNERKHQVNNCLDEIEISIENLKTEKNKEKQGNLESWIRKNKKHLKLLKYKGKIKRKSKI